MSDLDIALAAMANHGTPTLCLLDNGWWCSLNMHVIAIGASVKVASNFSHKTPTAAALECNARMQALLRGSSDGKQKGIAHG